jgi:glycosyltransferase 2 family protein
MRRAPGLAIQLLASAALMWLLLSRVGVDEVAYRLVVRSPAAAATALVLIAVQLGCCTIRWRLICAALKVDVPNPRVTLGWVGLGFALNQVLPSSIGGDGYRIVALGRHAGIGAATRTVVADRVAGLLTLAVLALASSAAAIRHTVSSPAFSAFALASAAVLIAGALAGVVARLLARWTASRLVKLVATDFATMYSKATLPPVFGISVAIHLLSMAIVVCVGASLALDEVRWWQAALVVPGTLLAMAVPISVGGWGVRESSMVFGLTAFGISSATALALSIGYGLASAVAGAIGVCFWMVGSQQRGGH